MKACHFKLVRIKREFIWHQHPDADEVFMVIDGHLHIDLRNKRLCLKKGEMVVIPKGVEHQPSSTEACKILLIQPVDTVNTGDAGGEWTDTKVEWI
jgi:mannose-6-phosphate isomerase-like protein (cupin superfamily)